MMIDFTRALGDGFLGFGESYMNGWWDCDSIDELVYRSLRAGIDKKFKPWKEFVAIIKATLINLQSQLRAREVGRRHYDVSIDLYRRMLDKRMIYSCGYWISAAVEEERQDTSANGTRSRS